MRVGEGTCVRVEGLKPVLETSIMLISSSTERTCVWDECKSLGACGEGSLEHGHEGVARKEHGPQTPADSSHKNKKANCWRIFSRKHINSRS